MKATYKLNFLSFMCLSLLWFRADAQTLAELGKKYPAFVIYQVGKIASKASLTTKEQTALADYFIEQNRIAENALKSNVSVSTLNTYYDINPEVLRHHISPVSYCDYLYNTEPETSQLVSAVANREILKLNQKQLDALIKAIRSEHFAEKGHQSAFQDDPFNRYHFQSAYLRQILTDTQYQKNLEMIALPQAMTENSASWQKLKKLTSVNIADSARISDENLKYFLKTACIENEIRNGNTLVNRDSIRNTFFSFKPATLLKLDMISNDLPESQLSAILKNRRSIVLSAVQIDSLINRVRQLEVLRQHYRKKNPYQQYDATKFEALAISEVLIPDQINLYLVAKNRDKAISNEKKTWLRITQYGLSKNLDSIKVNEELLSYEIRKLVVMDKYYMSATPENARIRKSAETEKPEILKQLDIAMRTETYNANKSNALTW